MDANAEPEGNGAHAHASLPELWRGPWVAPNVYVAHTTLAVGGEKLKRWGVFCSETIEAGAFIAAFTGEFISLSKFNKGSKGGAGHAMRRHAVQLDFSNIGGKQEESQMLYAINNGESDFPYLHIAQCLNEPPSGKEANATFYVHHYARDESQDEYYSAVLVYAATPIQKSSEIFLHYGSGYEKDRERNGYKVGSPAAWPRGQKHEPSMDAVVEKILTDGSRSREIAYREGRSDPMENVPKGGTRSRPAAGAARPPR